MNDEYFMDEAIKEAKIAFLENEVPVGAVLVIDGKIVARGHNKKEKKHDVTSHAEIESIRDLSGNLKNYNLKDATLYVTLEPCVMCAGAIIDSNIKRVVFGATDDEKGAIISNYHVFDKMNPDRVPLISYGVREDECSALIKTFFQKIR